MIWINSVIKRVLLKYKKRLIVDGKSTINFGVVNQSINPRYPCKIFNSICTFNRVNEGCRVSEARCYGDISLGRFVTITGPGTIISSIKEEIYIGSFTSIGQNVCIVDFNHRHDRITSSFLNNKIFGKEVSVDVSTKGPVIIEEDVWIGSNTLILPGVRVGRGSIIGGGSVVTHDIPKYSIAYGNPAAVHSKRFDNSIINFLEELRWWEWDIDKIIKNANLFSINLRSCSTDAIKSKIT